MKKLSVRVTIEEPFSLNFFLSVIIVLSPFFWGNRLTLLNCIFFSYFSTCYVPVGKFSPKKAKLVFLYTLVLVGVVETRVEKGKSCKRSIPTLNDISNQ